MLKRMWRMINEHFSWKKQIFRAIFWLVRLNGSDPILETKTYEYNSASEYLTYAVIWRTTTTKEPLFFVERVEKYVK